MIDYTYQPRLAVLLVGGVLLAVAILASYAWAKGRSNRRVRLALALVRWLVVAAVVICLLDPQWVEAIKHQQKSRVAVLLDTSRSMGIKDLPQERLTVAKSWIHEQLNATVPSGVSVSYYGFDQALTPLPNPDTAAATGESTGLADALENLLAVPGDDPLGGVVICSDGIENLRNDAEAIARLYRRKGVPIHTVTVGTTNEMHDVVVENVQVRRAVPNKAPTKIAVTLRAPGYARQSVPIQVLHENDLVAIKDVPLTGNAQTVELEFTPKQKGFQTYEVRVPAQTGEWLTSNNRRQFGLEVIDPTIRVLYMEGTPQQPNSPIPEWKYLKSALESDPDIKVTTLYREFGANGKRLHTVDIDPETGQKIYPVEHPTRGFPHSLAALLEYDVVIHSDIRKESFTSDQLQNIARLVEEFGGGFVMIGGNSAFGKGGYHRTILDRIIPVAMRQVNDSQAAPFRMQVPGDVWNHPIIALGNNRQETEFIWTKKLPFLYGYNVVDRAKPGAIVLGNDPSSPGPLGPRLVMAVQNVGSGRSMAFTSDTTRTWGKDFETLWGEKLNPSLPLSENNCDSRYYRKFWANAVRWLAAPRIARTNAAVTLELAQSYCQPDEKVAVSVKVQDKSMREINTAEVSLFVSSGGKSNLVVKPAFDNASHAYIAELALHEPGNFLITAVATAKGTNLGEDRRLLVSETADREYSDLRAKPDLMASLAQLSGGKALSLTNAESRPEGSLFSNAPPATMEYHRTPLWDRSWFLAAVLGLLAVEWAVRRWTGMA